MARSGKKDRGVKREEGGLLDLQRVYPNGTHIRHLKLSISSHSCDQSWFAQFMYLRKIWKTPTQLVRIVKATTQSTTLDISDIYLRNLLITSEI